MRPRIFFYFCDLDFIDFFNFFGGIHGYFAINLESKVVFMKCEKKVENTEGKYSFAININQSCGILTGERVVFIKLNWKGFLL